MPQVEISKEKNKIKIKGKNLYLAKERAKSRELFFDLEIENSS
jgi:exopolyphosphatase/guanosine-5'-triphosphate,3'-diphosphate pyrophosphatase